MPREPEPRSDYALTAIRTRRNNHRAKPGLKFFKAAAKKVAAFFTFSLGQSKPSTKDAVLTYANTITSQTRGSSFSSNHSTGSSYTQKSGKLRSSGSLYSSNNNSRSEQNGIVIFSFQEIQKATGNFSLANKIGEGRFGTVYKGRLNNGSMVAVKRAKRNNNGKCFSQEFKNEIFTLSKIEHLNLVRLFGFLEHKDEQILLVEFVGNGTLREHLDNVRGNGLEMAERLDVAIDVAHAITYLHMYTDPPIIHRDIKASNVLITEKLRAKVADFGFARMAVEDPSATHISTQIKGSVGYVDPEYMRTYQLTEKSDVYSFGVLLVELMSGRRPIEPKKQLKERVTVRWALQKLKEGDAIFLMDPMMKRSPASNKAMERVLKLAHQCLAPVRHSRPSMKKCGEVLWGIRKEFRENTFSASQHSANFVMKDAKNERKVLFGIQDGDSHDFISA
ncbi:calmodulin-binding receptor-like cytoplasmic kinase 1 [Carica papaya]|uniref:calmodulin-binding receptor-like cytoplasmic kinase 1 n=1 Tax=Carica papaya TaxID=3649 RepID=UPI000B8D0F0E|nr:calmodulin-binding receptor-like cytoplasmic kinase 1 [Carica papaya]